MEVLQCEIRHDHKSIPPSVFVLPILTILTGPNGSGKTHLLEALADRKSARISMNGKLCVNIHYIGFGRLSPTLDQKVNVNEISTNARRLYRNMEQARQTSKGKKEDNEAILSRVQKEDREQIDRISKVAKLPLCDMTEDDFHHHVALIDYSNNSPFNCKLGELFLAYHMRFFDNLAYRSPEMSGSGRGLSDEDFYAKYGDPPWHVIDKLLDMLKLPYHVDFPLHRARDAEFQFLLKDKHSGKLINSNDLSSGEKTLMSLALAQYNVNGDSIKSDLLLLDEPDASLHPSMSKLLLKVLEEVSVRHNIPVVMTTHSPATVACAPPTSIYSITREEKTPKQISHQAAIRQLTSEIPNFHMSIDSRWLVFVESKYDALVYESMYLHVNKHLQHKVEPFFMAPHTREGTNCEDVKSMMDAMSNAGYSQIMGIIDGDMKNRAGNKLIILGDGNRYSIENYVFEPIILALYLIRMGYAKASEFDSKAETYRDITHDLDPERKQRISDAVCRRLKLSEERVETELIDGSRLKISIDILKMKGHDLENKIIATWPKLNSALKDNQNKGEAALKLDVIAKAVSESPDLLSKDIRTTFERIGQV